MTAVLKENCALYIMLCLTRYHQCIHHYHYYFVSLSYEFSYSDNQDLRHTAYASHLYIFSYYIYCALLEFYFQLHVIVMEP